MYPIENHSRTRPCKKPRQEVIQNKEDEYFFKIGNGQLTEISSVKKMIENFPDKQNELKEFVRREKISKNEEDLIKLVRYYNSL